MYSRNEFTEWMNFMEYRFLPIALIAVFLILAVFFIIDRMKKLKMQIKIANKENAHGFIFGRKGRKYFYSPTDAEGHIAVFGGSGLGKTKFFLCPSLNSMRDYTSLVIDISNDISNDVEAPNKLIYDAEREDSIPYNVFASIDKIEGLDDKNQALMNLAELLLPVSEKMSDATKFFTEEGKKILSASLIAFYHQGKDFVEICDIVVGNSWNSLFKEIEKAENALASKLIASFRGTAEKNTAGSKQVVDKCLYFFSTNTNVRNNLRRPKENEIAISPMSLETHNVYVKIDDAVRKLYSPVLNIIVVQSLNYIASRPNYCKPTICVVLDEFVSLGKMDIVETLRKARKKSGRVIVLTQSMADIDELYGKDTRMVMMNNFRFKVILGADDTDTQEYFTKLIGQERTMKRSTSTSLRQITHTKSEDESWIIKPSELGRLRNKLVVLHPDGHLVLNKNIPKRKSKRFQRKNGGTKL